MTNNEATNAHRCEADSVKSSVLSKLTPREYEILDLIGRGLSTAEIASQLHRSEKTIKSHRLALGRKLKVSNRVALARIAIEEGLAPLKTVSAETSHSNRQFREEIAQHERAQQALLALDAGTETATGEDFFKSLVRHLTEVLDVKFALIGELNGNVQKEIHSISVRRCGADVENFSFKITSTPCEHILQKGMCFNRKVVKDDFHIPESFGMPNVSSYLGTALLDTQGTPIGVLMVASDKEIDESIKPELILSIFADRTGAELQRLKMEVQLRHSESRLAEAQRITHLGHWDWDIVNDKVEWSDEVFQIFGAQRGEFTGSENAFLSRIHPEDRSRVVQAIDAALYKRSPYREEFRLLRPDGEIRHGISRGEVTYDSTGRPIHMLGTVQDITERIRTVTALRDSEQLHRLIAENVPALMAYADRDLRYRFVNERFAAWFGLTRTQLIGQSVPDIIGEKNYNIRKDQIERALRGEMQSYEQDSTGDGTHEERWFNVVCAPDIDQEGAVQGIYFLITDITEQKRTSESLREMCESMGLQFREQRRELCDTNAELNREIRLRLEIEDNLRIAQSHLQSRLLARSAVMYTSEPGGDFGATYMSENVRDMLGYEPESFVGQNTFWNNHIHPDDLDRVIEGLTALNEGKRFVLEYRFLHQDGTYRWLYDELNTIFDDEGTPIEIMGFVLDITDRKNFEIDLQRATRGLEHRVDERNRELSIAHEALRTESSHRTKAEAGLQAVLKGTAFATGEEFFRVLVEHLSEAVGMSRSFLCELSDSEAGTLQVVATWPNHEVLDPNMSYEFAETPCEIVLRDGFYCHPADIQTHFAQDDFLRDSGAESYLGMALQDSKGRRIGVLSVLGEQPITNPDYAESILKIFASRASAEFQRIHAERLVVSSQAREKAILASTLDPLVVIDIQGIIQSASRSMEDVFGWSVEELVGRNINILMPEPYRTQHNESFKRFRATQDSKVIGKTLEFQGLHRNGNVFPIELTIWSDGTPGEAGAVFTGIIRDISKRKESESNLRMRVESE
ncbi:MAG: PAS domain S-box protein [Planctomycetota bacterium]|nr:PAS domain S-box protein [Planctomycetota bacterium]